MAGGRAGAAARQAAGAAQSLRRQSEGGRHSKYGVEAEEGRSRKRGSVPREARLWQAEGKAHWDTEAPRGHTGSPATTVGQRGWLDTQPPAGPSLLQGTKKAAGRAVRAQQGAWTRPAPQGTPSQAPDGRRVSMYPTEPVAPRRSSTEAFLGKIPPCMLQRQFKGLLRDKFGNHTKLQKMQEWHWKNEG